MNGVTLRPYQAAAVDGIRAAYVRGDDSTLLVLPTGTGKTIVFAEVARRVMQRGGRVLVLAHREELLSQAAEKLKTVGIERATSRAGNAEVVVAGVQTLRGPRLASWPADSFRLLVVDEAHHATAASYRTILHRFAAARVLGVTATPDRLDRTPLGRVFESVAFTYELRDAIKDGWLCRIEARRVRLAVDLDQVHTRAGDLDHGELGEVYGTAGAVREVIEPLLELAGERRTIVFAVSVTHAEHLAATINERVPGAARAVSGEMPMDDRRAVVESFRAGQLRVLVNCQLYTEGFDVPEVECIAIARPTKSRALYTQMVGRGTRLAPGKESFLVPDFVGNTTRHKLVTPAAILAGADAGPELVQRAARADGDVLDALEHAAAEQLELASRAPRRMRFWAEVVDLFGVPDERNAGAAATARQIDALMRAGLKPPADLTRAAASQIIDGLVARRARGLASYKQVRLLARLGVDARAMDFAEASARISDVLSRCRARAAAGDGQR